MIINGNDDNDNINDDSNNKQYAVYHNHSKNG